LQEVVILLSTKSYGTILNSFSWPRSGEEQDVLNKLITQIVFILTSKTDHIFNPFGIIIELKKPITIGCYVSFALM